MSKRSNNLKDFYLLWSTQALSQLGSAVTSFALTLWLYEKTGSALHTAMLTICTYVPYVLVSIFAGALTDKWDKKKTMLVCDVFTALGTVAIFLLIRRNMLQEWHIYIINALIGLMNTVQEPASEVAVTLVTPKEYYQKTSGLKSFSRSLISIMNPVIATAMYSLAGMNVVIAFDLITFAAAFLALLIFIEIPEYSPESGEEEPLLEAVRKGFRCLNENRVVLWLILFLAGVNLVASTFDAILPAFIIPQPTGGEKVLGAVTSTAGIAMLAGSIIVSAMPAPEDRIRMILLSMLFSLTTDNFLMSLTDIPLLWCIAQVMGYLPVPFMSTNLDVIVRETIPTEMQGRVYACRNSLQFFTIPVGYFLGGWLVDEVFEPYMAGLDSQHLFVRMFGEGKGSGAGMLIFLLGVAAIFICAAFDLILRKYHRGPENAE